MLHLLFAKQTFKAQAKLFIFFFVYGLRVTIFVTSKLKYVFGLYKCVLHIIWSHFSITPWSTWWPNTTNCLCSTFKTMYL